MRRWEKVTNMSRNVATRALAVLLASPTLAAAGQDPPPLAPPALIPPTAEAPSEPPKAVVPAPTSAPPASRIPESRPVLAIPGVTAPARARTQPRPAEQPPLDLATPRELPVFDNPTETAEPAPDPGAKPRQIPSRVEGSRVLESVPLNAPANTRPSLSARPTDTPSPTPGRAVTRPDNPPPAPGPDPMRRPPPGFLGRLFPAPYPTARPAPADRRSVTVEPRSDPAADAALQRRIERQVREAVGDRVKMYEVRVVDRNVTVRVRVSRFWQKRAVRHTLETLPSLNGLRARVEVVE